MLLAGLRDTRAILRRHRCSVGAFPKTGKLPVFLSLYFSAAIIPEERTAVEVSWATANVRIRTVNRKAQFLTGMFVPIKRGDDVDHLSILRAAQKNAAHTRECPSTLFASPMLYIRYETNVPGPSGVGKTHIALALGLAACQKGRGVRFATASYLVHELIVARDEKRQLRLQAQFARVTLLIIDELGYVPLSQTGSELLFDVFSQRYENVVLIVVAKLLAPYRRSAQAGPPGDFEHRHSLRRIHVSTAEENWSNVRRKTGPLCVMQVAALAVVPVVHRRDPRGLRSVRFTR